LVGAFVGFNLRNPQLQIAMPDFNLVNLLINFFKQSFWRCLALLNNWINKFFEEKLKITNLTNRIPFWLISVISTYNLIGKSFDSLATAFTLHFVAKIAFFLFCF